MSEDNREDVGQVSLESHTLTIEGGIFNDVQGNQNISNTHIYSPVYNAVSNKEPTTLSERQEALLRILPRNSFRRFHQSLRDKRAPGTGLVFQNRSQIQEWFSKIDGFVWVTGAPGAGKTYQASAIIDSIEQIAEGSADTVTVFAYIEYTDSQRLTTWDIIAAFVRQIVEYKPSPAILGPVERVFSRHADKETRPTLRELVTLLKDLLSQFHQRFASLDGLDEMRAEVQSELLNILLSLPANVFVTSRPLELLEVTLLGHRSRNPVLMTFSAPPEDLDVYIREMVAGSPDLTALLSSATLKYDVDVKVKDNAHGMFLHAALQLEELSTCVTEQEIEEKLDSAPEAIEDFYAATLDRVYRQAPNRAALAKRILMWVLNVTGTLSVADLQYVMAVSPTSNKYDYKAKVLEGFIVSVCHGLITVDKETRQVRLVHLSAREPLLRLLAPLHPNPHAIILKVCIGRLINSSLYPGTTSTMTVSRRREIFAESPLLEYAYKYSPHHTRHLTPVIDATTITFVHDFIRGCVGLPYLNRIYPVPDEDPLYPLGPLHVAVLFNLPLLVQEMLDRNEWDVNAVARRRGDDAFTPLIVAAREGCNEAAEVLLACPGVDTSVVEGLSRTPLIVAASYGNDVILRRIMDIPGVDVNAIDKSGYTSLMVASRFGVTSSVATLLRSSKVDVNRQDPKEGWTALFLASDYGYDAIVALLINHPSVDVNLQDVQGWSPLMIAIRRGHLTVARLLLRRPGIDVKTSDHKGWTSLMKAAYWGRDEILEELLKFPNLPINGVDDQGRSSLMLAVYRNHHPVVKRLLQVPGVDCNLCDSFGWTPVMTAAYEGSLEVLELLLEFPETNLQRKTKARETILLLALSYFSKKYHSPKENNEKNDVQRTCSLLLRYRPIRRLVNVADKAGRTPLKVALEMGYSALVEKLLEVPGIHADDVYGDLSFKVDEKDLDF